jgi:hypothetical protein
MNRTADAGFTWHSSPELEHRTDCGAIVKTSSTGKLVKRESELLDHFYRESITSQVIYRICHHTEHCESTVVWG